MEKNSVVMVTGATGFVGSHLIPKLFEKGFMVKALVRSEEKAKNLRDQGCEIVIGDVTDLPSLEKATKETQAVIHLVSVTREKGRTTFEAVNRRGTKNVVEAMEKAGVPRIIYTSIVKAGPQVKSTYLVSKWQSEEEIRKSDRQWSIIRSSLIYGPRGAAIITLANLTKRLPVLPVLGNGKYKQQPIFVEDVVSCLIKALEDDQTIGKIFEIGGPEALEYDQILDILGEVLGKKRRKIHLPLFINRPFIALGERILPNPLVTLPELELLIMDPIPEKNDIQEVFGIDPIPFREGLKKTFP